jgi:hypothetical protein
MANKPNKQDILDTYSFKELLDILEQKALHDSQGIVNSIRDNLPSILGGTSSSRRTELPSRRTIEQDTEEEIVFPGRGRRKSTSQTKSTDGDRGGARGAREGSLTSFILDSLGNKPKSTDEILADIQRKGWSTKSNQPKTLITQTLVALTKKGDAKKEGRGQYVKG